ncbi:MAG: CPBP family glutamic-type intramembrane protease [Candidatus Acidiferrales bacterium]
MALVTLRRHFLGLVYLAHFLFHFPLSMDEITPRIVMLNPAETWIGGLTTSLASLAYCVSLRLTGDLWFAIGLHAGWDWTETYLFGVADSGFPARGHLLHTTLAGPKWLTGGTVGPEASIIEILVTLMVIVLTYLRFRHFSKPRSSAAPRIVVHPA